MEGYCWLRSVRIPRQWEDVRLEKGVGLDDGVTLLCSGDRRRDKLVLGRECYVNRYTILDAHVRSDVGARAMIGPHCYITDSEHGFKPGEAVMDQPMTSAPVIIGEGAWIGTRVTVKGGVRIGRGAIVGVGAVVEQDIPDNAIAVGAPARVVRMRG
jgi:acetyltransferase-like isoleucine patch superfamily enzyme